MDAAAAGAAVFPVVFDDGDSEIDIGDVSIHPAIDFKAFQSIMSHKIGISPHQITLYLVCPRKSRSFSDRPRRIPITAKDNFASFILHQHRRGSFFLAALKRSRRDRRRRHRGFYEDVGDGGSIIDAYNAEPPQPPPVPEKLMLLRRGQGSPYDGGAGGFLAGAAAPFYDPLLALNLQREKYLMAMKGSDSYSRSAVSDRVVCEDCFSARERGETAPFHWCVHDAVTVGFRSPAGPIARPAKPSN